MYCIEVDLIVLDHNMSCRRGFHRGILVLLYRQWEKLPLGGALSALSALIKQSKQISRALSALSAEPQIK